MTPLLRPSSAPLTTEEKLNPLIDQLVQNVPAAQRLGSRWSLMLFDDREAIRREIEAAVASVQ